MNLKLVYRAAFLLSAIGLLAFFLDFGFSQSSAYQAFLNRYYAMVLLVGILATTVRYAARRNFANRKAIIFDVLSVSFSVLILIFWFYEPFQPTIFHDMWIKVAVLLTFIREFSELRLNYKRSVLHPAQLFILSFLAIVMIGSLLLMMPEATTQPIEYIDALFTSTSAVCVTGLGVVDTGTRFTLFGQVTILMLIQIGGLGILTFASYFSYFFKGGSTYENQLVIGDMTNAQKLGEVYQTIKQIITITFSIEFFAALFIYLSTDSCNYKSTFDQIWFSVFHSISAFCNAGFSTLPNNLYQLEYRFNYSLQIAVILTFVLGGLGFPIVSNFVNYLKYKVKILFTFPRKKKVNYRPWVLNINSRITLITTLIVMAVGFIGVYIIEYNNTLAEHQSFGKIVTALFGATTPRTAGFNSVNFAEMHFATIMLIFLLMWIGASPASTGGGIKTSTFAIASLNIFSLAKGKTRVEIFRREISDLTIRRAFATIALSLIAIGFGVFAITFFDEGLNLRDIAFECFSAYSTVGLSLGITATLSAASKFVLIILMFVGRVSMLTIVIAVFVKIKHKNYRYPTEEMIIN